jgi:hypothetical protein
VARSTPLELLADDQRDDAGPLLALCGLQVRPDVIELAVIPAAAIRRTEPQTPGSDARAQTRASGY